MKVAVIKYNAGNVASVVNALKRIGAEPLVSDDPETIAQSDRVIFPGVGEASTAMSYLRDRKLDELIKRLTQPVLGVCLGMQLMCAYSEENSTECLGLFPTTVRRFVADGLKVPHMGWNTIANARSRLFDGVREDSYVYFVHSYYLESTPDTIAESRYGADFAAAIARNNFYAVQFHPEKSGVVGERILENFLRI
ncbi:MAG TPA: imidazole glycerol phosphate synthase subunit HisH [Pyrinomonadaceae bacterium]|nr:imidazole glycerol phosphate synthase subunit HisH [Pyrinomonadaceae bacterium]